MFEKDTDANVFNTIWSDGYVEDFGGHREVGCTKHGKADVINILARFYNKEHTCLEVGCGGGMWTTECLIPNFKHVTCLDVIPQKFIASCRYVQVANKDFYCTGVEDESIDFLFSFGVFCHLSAEAQATYLKSLYRKLKPGGRVLLMFANFKRHPYFVNMSEEVFNTYRTEGIRWFYMDLKKTEEIVSDAGFVGFIDTIPDFRDTLAYFEKAR